MVKRSRLQSAEMPRRRCWPMITGRVSSMKRHMRSRYFSRPSSSGVVPSSARTRRSTHWAAIEAWSTPGSQSAGRCCMRARRIMRSSVAERAAWPRCSAPVTLGGGMMMTKGSSVGRAREPRAIGREDVGLEPARHRRPALPRPAGTPWPSVPVPLRRAAHVRLLCRRLAHACRSPVGAHGRPRSPSGRTRSRMRACDRVPRRRLRRERRV